MNILDISFPDLKEKEEETLYIIGNGFDLFHGLNTSYNDFYCWLIVNGHKSFVSMMERIFPRLIENKRENLLWSDFESALGSYDLEYIHKEFGPKKEQFEVDYELQEKASVKIRPTLNEINILLKEWAIDCSKKITISKDTNKLQLPKESFYLSFNYTTVLEKLYKIPENNVLHIHGSAMKPEDQLIVGHKTVPVGIECDDVNKKKSLELIMNEMQKFYKQTSEIIKNNSNKLDRLKDIDRIVVLGHSLSIIDMPYFNKVIESVKEDSHWHFSAHDVKGIANVHNLIKWQEEMDKQPVLGRINNRTKKLNLSTSWIFNM